MYEFKTLFHRLIRYSYRWFISYIIYSSLLFIPNYGMAKGRLNVDSIFNSVKNLDRDGANDEAERIILSLKKDLPSFSDRQKINYYLSLSNIHLTWQNTSAALYYSTKAEKLASTLNEDTLLFDIRINRLQLLAELYFVYEDYGDVKVSKAFLEKIRSTRKKTKKNWLRIRHKKNAQTLKRNTFYFLFCNVQEDSAYQAALSWNSFIKKHDPEDLFNLIYSYHAIAYSLSIRAQKKQNPLPKAYYEVLKKSIRVAENANKTIGIDEAYTQILLGHLADQNVDSIPKYIKAYEDFIQSTLPKASSNYFKVNAHYNLAEIKWQYELLKNKGRETDLVKELELRRKEARAEFPNLAFEKSASIYEDLNDHEQAITDRINENAKTTRLTLGILIILISATIMFFTGKRLQEKYAYAKKEKALLEKNLILRNEQSKLKGQEEERKKIAAELHDEVANSIAGIKFKIAALEPDVGTQGQIGVLNNTKQELKILYTRIRSLSDIIDSPILEKSESVEQMLKDLFEEYNMMYVFEVKHSFDSIQRLNNLNIEQQKNLYLLLQELLLNALKHADAQIVKIDIKTVQNTVRLHYKDDGLGTDEDTIKKGFNSLRNRVQLLNGEIEISSPEQYGLTILIEFPIAASI